MKRTDYRIKTVMYRLHALHEAEITLLNLYQKQRLPASHFLNPHLRFYRRAHASLMAIRFLLRSNLGRFISSPTKFTENPQNLNRFSPHCLSHLNSICGYHDGRPRGPLWRGKKMIGKEAVFVIMGLKRFKGDEEKMHCFVKKHVIRLLKSDKIAVLNELERQQEVDLALKIFKIIQKDDWYKPDVFLYKDLITALAKLKKMEAAMDVWSSMQKENLFPDSQTYSEVIRGFLRYGSPADAMNIYEDMKKSPDPPEVLPFRILLKGLLPHPLLRNRVKQDFEELFPQKHMYDPPDEIFGMH